MDDLGSFEVALGRLTENEKDVLRRWMMPQTAKEIALDLGISPHAVEKRLRMARAKLGVSSSLQAARLLAASEGYQKLVPHKSDLFSASISVTTQARDGPTERADQGRSSIGWAIGGGMTIILLAGAMAFVGLAQEHPEASKEHVVAFLVSSFGTMDRDKSGFIEPLEAPRVAVRVENASERTEIAGVQGQNMWIVRHDRDGDGKVSEAEFVAQLLPVFLKRGVPANWRGNH